MVWGVWGEALSVGWILNSETRCFRIWVAASGTFLSSSKTRRFFSVFYLCPHDSTNSMRTGSMSVLFTAAIPHLALFLTFLKCAIQWLVNEWVNLHFFHWISRTSLIHRNISTMKLWRTEAPMPQGTLVCFLPWNSCGPFVNSELHLKSHWQVLEEKTKVEHLQKNFLNWAFAKSLPNYCTGFYDLTF